MIRENMLRFATNAAPFALGASVLLFVLSGCNTPRREHHPDEIDLHLDRLDTEEAFAGDWIASGPETEIDVLLRQNFDVWWLAGPAGYEAVPRIAARIASHAYTRPDTLFVYFVILGRSGYSAAIPVVLDYLESLPDRTQEAYREECQGLHKPNVSATWALEQLAAPALERQPERSKKWTDWDEYAHRRETVACVRTWLKQYGGG